MEQRNLRKCTCDSCGSWFETFYDIANDEYLCSECLEAEEEEE